jgi:hypothetical protein
MSGMSGTGDVGDVGDVDREVWNVFGVLERS